MPSWVLVCVLESLAALGCEAAPAQHVDAPQEAAECSLPDAGCFAGYYVTQQVSGQAAPFTPPAFAIDGDGSGGAIGFACTDTQEAMACSSATNSPVLFSHLTDQGGVLTNNVATTEPHACATDPTKGSCVTRFQSVTLTRPAWIPDGVQIESCTADFPEPSCTTPLPDHCDPVDPDQFNGCAITVIAGEYTE